jgi:hypothetical protein
MENYKVVSKRGIYPLVSMRVLNPKAARDNKRRQETGQQVLVLPRYFENSY